MAVVTSSDAAMVQLKNRFNSSAAGLHRLLCFLGLDPAPESKCKTNIWRWLCFLVMSQAGLFVFLVRSAPHLKGFLINVLATLPLLDRSIRLFSVSFIHLILLLKLGRILYSKQLSTQFGILSPTLWRPLSLALLIDEVNSKRVDVLSYFCSVCVYCYFLNLTVLLHNLLQMSAFSVLFVSKSTEEFF